MNLENPLVSVIIPNFNHGKYLTKRIDSVINQTYSNIEVIILDDCSIDNSLKIINEYKDHPKVRHILINDKNSGSPFIQWKKGIEQATGDLIWLAESDDWCEPTFLENVVPPILNDESIVISYCQSYCVNENTISWQSQHHLLSEKVDSQKFISEYLTPNPAIFNASMAVWQKKYFNAISDDYLSYKFSGDWLFWLELAKKGNVHISGKILNYFRKHDADVSSSAYQTGLNFIEGLKILSYCQTEKLISTKKFQKALKKNIKEYYLVKQNMTNENKEKVKKILINKHSKAFYYKCILSAVWKKIKQ